VLQEFMVDRMKVGMLLCLCSKNNEADALAVFEQRCDMPLKREHLAACRLNWNRKSENIKALGRELNLGLDAFIFIDDNPVDCADVKINCPEVLTLQLPTDPALFPSFLNHIWPFDRTGSTEEDQNRTQLYQENWQRQKFRDQTLSLKDFIKGLQLQIEITEATEDQLGRVSQLTFRTNQFNFTTIRRSENELRAFLKRKGAKCVVVRVADRFGDYGLVGALLYDSHGDRYQVNTFLLSCRVLGRGVEHAALAWLGQQALKEGKGFVELTYVPTDKNAPALDFLKSLGENGTSWTFSANRLAGLQYDPDRSTEAHPNAKTPKPSARRAAWSLDGVQQIGESLYNISLISKAIEEYRLKKEPALASAELAGGNALEIALLNIWRKVLGRSSIGLNDNFFEAGGTSLRAVQVIAAIKKELKQTLSIVSLFECPTVSLLAARMSGATPVETSTASAATRGQRRRYNIGGPTPARATT
jgi:FkbH-like protein